MLWVLNGEEKLWSKLAICLSLLLKDRCNSSWFSYLRIALFVSLTGVTGVKSIEMVRLASNVL